MKKWKIVATLLSVILIWGGCNLTPTDSSNSLVITNEDENVIFNYLDNKTNDIISPRGGTMYSAFEILGTDGNKIYLWMSKEECIKKGNNIEWINGVSLPVVLHIKSVEGKIEIKRHQSPEDGERYNKSIKKLFPENVRSVMFNHYEERSARLRQIIRHRANEL